MVGCSNHSQGERSDSEQLRLFAEDVAPNSSAAGSNGTRPARTVEAVVDATLDHLNRKTERTGAAKFTSPTSIKERIRDGACLSDFLLVIDFCHAMWWEDPKMETYIRPKTLFGKENFPEYLVRARKWSEEGRPPLLGGAAQEGAGDRRLDMYTAHVKGGRGDPGRADRS